MKNIISEIKRFGEDLKKKTKEELDNEIFLLKKRLFLKKDSLDSLLIPCFALIQEISFREINLKHFDKQLEAGFHLHQGKVVEMKTGEGKTLASTLAIGLNALENRGVHVVTINDYLAERDEKWMGQIYKGLGLNSGLIKMNSSISDKKKSYNSHITYITNSQIVFDYLKDNCASNKKDIDETTKKQKDSSEH